MSFVRAPLRVPGTPRILQAWNLCHERRQTSQTTGPFRIHVSLDNPSEKASALAIRRLLQLKPRARLGNFLCIYDIRVRDIAQAGMSEFTFYYYEEVRYVGLR